MLGRSLAEQKDTIGNEDQRCSTSPRVINQVNTCQSETDETQADIGKDKTKAHTQRLLLQDFAIAQSLKTRVHTEA